MRGRRLIRWEQAYIADLGCPTLTSIPLGNADDLNPEE